MGWNNKFFLVFFIAIFVGFMASSAFSSNSQEFTFSSSELIINGQIINETLTYYPDTYYHTLYRNFDSNVVEVQSSGVESILIKNVECSSGKPYSRNIYGECLYYDGVLISSCIDYTENNEYGCGFGNQLGFNKGLKYIVGAEYKVEPPQLLEFNGEYYIKFIAYKPDKHPTLKINENFFVEGGIFKDKYYSFDPVIIYIPYEPENIDFYNVEHVNKLNYSKKPISLFVIVILVIVLIIIFMVIKHKIKENTFNVPHELSHFPLTKRKPWDVALFNLNKTNVIPATLMDFYKRKIIDIKTEKEKKWIFTQYKTYFKILKEAKGLDEVEAKVYNLLKIIQKKQKPKEGYFDLNPTLYFSRSSELTTFSSSFLKLLRKLERNIYVFDFWIIILILLLFFSVLIFSALFGMINLFILGIIIFSFLIYLSVNTLIKFKSDEIQKEYLEWKSFKRFLENSYSMKASEVKGVILWNEYLIYATALGVSGKILRKLKNQGLITEEQYVTSVHTFGSFNALSTSSGFGGGSGGGAGGGGAGGGGGGGR